MTAMNWIMSEMRVLILCDTLAISETDHRPAFMTTKVHFWPHLGACVAGTGAQPLAQTFFMQVNSGSVVRDVVHLDEFAGSMLADIWRTLTDAAPPGATGTVYTFGWSEAEGRFTGFAYRSTSSFKSERLNYGLAVKPPPKNAAILDNLNDFEAYLDLLRVQKDEDRERPRTERIGIGGEVILTLMTRSDAGFTCVEQRTVHRFDDYQQDWSIILAKLQANAGHPLSDMMLALDP